MIAGALLEHAGDVARVSVLASRRMRILREYCPVPHGLHAGYRAEMLERAQSAILELLELRGRATPRQLHKAVVAEFGSLPKHTLAPALDALQRSGRVGIDWTAEGHPFVLTGERHGT